MRSNDHSRHHCVAPDCIHASATIGTSLNFAALDPDMNDRHQHLLACNTFAVRPNRCCPNSGVATATYHSSDCCWLHSIWNMFVLNQLRLSTAIGKGQWNFWFFFSRNEWIPVLYPAHHSSIATLSPSTIHPNWVQRIAAKRLPLNKM